MYHPFWCQFILAFSDVSMEFLRHLCMAKVHSWGWITIIIISFHSLLKCHTSFDNTNIYQSCKIFQNTLKQMTSSHIWLMRHYYITLNNIQLYNYTTCDVDKVLKIVEEYMWRSVYVCVKGLNSVLMNWVQWFVAIVHVCD